MLLFIGLTLLFIVTLSAIVYVVYTSTPGAQTSAINSSQSTVIKLDESTRNEVKIDDYYTGRKDNLNQPLEKGDHKIKFGNYDAYLVNLKVETSAENESTTISYDLVVDFEGKGETGTLLKVNGIRDIGIGYGEFSAEDDFALYKSKKMTLSAFVKKQLVSIDPVSKDFNSDSLYVALKGALPDCGVGNIFFVSLKTGQASNVTVSDGSDYILNKNFIIKSNLDDTGCASPEKSDQQNAYSQSSVSVVNLDNSKEAIIEKAETGKYKKFMLESFLDGVLSYKVINMVELDTPVKENDIEVLWFKEGDSTQKTAKITQ